MSPPKAEDSRGPAAHGLALSYSLDKFVITIHDGMMAAEVVVTDAAREDLKALKNVVIAARLYKLIDRLKKWPEVSGVKSLSGNLAGWYRMRTGDYRLQFRVETTSRDATKRHRIIIEKAGHRDGFYED